VSVPSKCDMCRRPPEWLIRGGRWACGVHAPEVQHQARRARCKVTAVHPEYPGDPRKRLQCDQDRRHDGPHRYAKYIFPAAPPAEEKTTP